MKVRELPQEHNSEQHPGLGRERPARGGPSDDRGQRTGDRSDQGGPMRHSLQRCVDHHIAEQRRQGDPRGDPVGHIRQLSDSHDA